MKREVVEKFALAISVPSKKADLAKLIENYKKEADAAAYAALCAYGLVDSVDDQAFMMGFMLALTLTIDKPMPITEKCIEGFFKSVDKIEGKNIVNFAEKKAGL